jgi:hypothetical protein
VDRRGGPGSVLSWQKGQRAGTRRSIFFQRAGQEVTSGGTGDVAIKSGARPMAQWPAGGRQRLAARCCSNTTQHLTTPAINTLDSAHGPNPTLPARIHTPPPPPPLLLAARCPLLAVCASFTCLLHISPARTYSCANTACTWPASAPPAPRLSTPGRTTKNKEQTSLCLSRPTPPDRHVAQRSGKFAIASSVA